MTVLLEKQHSVLHFYFDGMKIVRYLTIKRQGIFLVPIKKKAKKAFLLLPKMDSLDTTVPGSQ